MARKKKTETETTEELTEFIEEAKSKKAKPPSRRNPRWIRDARAR